MSLIFKSIKDRGKPLTLWNVKWSESTDVDGEGSPITRHTASYARTSTSYLPGSGEYLTSNLVPGALSGGLVDQIGSAGVSTTGGTVGSSIVPSQYPLVSGGSNGQII